MNQDNNSFNNMIGTPGVPQNLTNELNNMNVGQINQPMPNVQPINPTVNQFNQPVQQPMPNVQPINPTVNQFNQPVQQPIQNNYQQPNYSQNPIDNGKKKNKIFLPLIIGILVALIGIILFFTLVGKDKTLVCTNSETSYGIKMDMEATMSFKRNRVTKVEALMTVDLGSYKNQKDVFINQFEKQFSSYTEKGVKLDITSDDSKIYIDIKADRSNFGVVNLFTSESYEAAKKELESDGFTCK